MTRARLFLAVMVPVLSGAEIPFVGCAADGQAGPVAPPPARRVEVKGPGEQFHHQLAWYESAHGSVIGPRGWHCLGFYGSGGWSILVKPEPVSSNGPAFAGAAISLRVRHGFTSGRFTVAEVLARILPGLYPDFTEGVLTGFSLEAKRPTAPFPGDRITYRGGTVAEYTTRAGKEGLGTLAGLAAGLEPIRGIAVVVEGNVPDLVLLAARLPAWFSGLHPAIVRHVETAGWKR